MSECKRDWAADRKLCEAGGSEFMLKGRKALAYWLEEITRLKREVMLSKGFAAGCNAHNADMFGEKAELEAQNAVLRQAAEQAQNCLMDMGRDAIIGQQKQWFNGSNEKCKRLFDAEMRLIKALAETPVYAAERVQGLVDALKEAQYWLNDGGNDVGDGSVIIMVKEALAKFEGGGK